MSNAIIEKLSYNDLQTFLTQYHQRLHAVESFPPLNPNKAMHIAAKSMGLKNAHVLKDQMPEDTQNGHENTQYGYELWDDDTVQFARVVAEFSMAADENSVAFEDVLASMDLERSELFELFARAESAFEKIKAGVVQAKPEIQAVDSVIVLVFNEKADSSGGSETYTSMEVVKNWGKAKEIIGNRVHSKGLDRADDDRTDQLLSVNCITTPDEDDEVDLNDPEKVLDWIIENNDVRDLANYLEYLDFDLTTVSMEEKYL